MEIDRYISYFICKNFYTMLPNINNAGDENAASSLFSTSLRNYKKPRNKSPKDQNPFSKTWLNNVIEDVREVRETEQMNLLQSQLLEIEKKCEIYSYQKQNMDVIKVSQILFPP